MSLVALCALGLIVGAEPFELGGVRLQVGGFAQVDGVLTDGASVDELDPSTGAPLNREAIQVRRARVRLEASKWLFGARFELEAGTVGPPVRVFDADVFVRWPAEGVPLVELKAGLVPIPFGADAQVRPRDRAFLEHATLAAALFPGDVDLGVQLSGAWRNLRYQLAVMNGEPSTKGALPPADPNAAKDFVGRLGVVAEPWLTTLEFGVSGLTGTGFHAGTPSTKDKLVWHDANEDGIVQLTELQVIGGLPATPSSNFDRFGLGADVHGSLPVPVLGLLELRAELVWAKNLDRGVVVADPVSAGRPVRELGWEVSVTQELPYGFLVGVRYDRYDPDADAWEFRGANQVPLDQTISTISAVASWRWERIARVMLQFDHQTNAFGRALDGSPTTLGGNRLTLRLEAGF